MTQTVIALDLHAVVFDFSFKDCCKALYAFFKKNPWYNLSLCNPLFVYRLIRELRTPTRTAERVYATLQTQYYPGLAVSADDFLDICNSYTINADVYALVRELKQAGCTIAVCSNIGKHAFERFYSGHRDFFDLCSVIVTSDPDDNYVRKPHSDFFTKFKQACYGALATQDLQFFFADDKRKNIRAARQAGIHGYHFKSAAKFRQFLVRHAVLS